jgi:3-(3-hydroxy-phenyl)propionate hydroxylase
MVESNVGAEPAPFDVLISGYGPVGALLATLLGRRGIRTAVFERDREIYRLPRAVHFDHEIMRIFQSVGLKEEYLPETASILGYEFWTAERELLFRFPVGQELTQNGWRGDYMFHQPALEAALRSAAESNPSVEIFLEHEVTALAEDTDGVTLTVRDLRDGNMRNLRAAFVVGCDGANSCVRKLTGLTLEDLAFDEPWLVLDAKISKPLQELGLPSQPTQLCDPARPTTFIPVAGPYIRWEFMLRPGEDREEVVRPENLDRMLAEWTDPAELEVIRTAVYDFHALVAERWNTRRVFLAGDAAHQTPPFLGQGMCAGMRDAANLAWKLALVLRGMASPKIFASYQEERSPHARQIIEIAVNLGRIICTQDPEVAKARVAQWLGLPSRDLETPSFPHIEKGLLCSGVDASGAELAGRPGLQARVRSSGGSTSRLDDVIGPGFALLAGGATAPELSAAARRSLEAVGGVIAWIPPSGGGSASDSSLPLHRLEDVDGAYAAWFADCGCDAVLVRPDHVVYGAGSGPDAASQLLEDLAVQLGSPA